MGKSTSRKAPFKIHVDASCLMDSTELEMSTERNTSNTTIVRHDSWTEDALEEPKPREDDHHDATNEEHQARERQIDRIEAEIKAAARAVVASIEQDGYRGNEDSVLSMQTDESYDIEGTDLTYDGTDMTYGSDNGHYEDERRVNGTDITYDSGNEEVSELNPDLDASEIISESGHEEVSELNHDMDTPEFTYKSGHEDNTPTAGSLEEAETGPEDSLEESVKEEQIVACDPTEQNIEQRAGIDEEDQEASAMPIESVKDKYEEEPIFENDRGGDSSSHHDGEGDDDDVFSHNTSHSARSSLNSALDLQSGEDTYSQKALTSPSVGEEANTRRKSDSMSRIPSSGSYMHPIPNTAQQQYTPSSKVLSRPPFRTPSSVRAMQMSSPTPSIYNSPRSVKRHLPTVSRIGTPTSNTSKNRTPTRFKPKKEQPLVLLHVTVLPLQWLYSHLMSSPDLPESLHYVKENWRFLQDKLGETVLERGILLPHPQDSFDVLEERLLEALELPVRPRALILKCGHYMGPVDLETPSSDDDEGGDYWNENITRRKWCDICRRDVRLESNNEPEGKRFRVKIYASNGLMHAGAWAAAWKEMERVDVEIGPWVESYQHTELEKLVLLKPKMVMEEHDDGFEDESMLEEVEEQVDARQEQPLETVIDSQSDIVTERFPSFDHSEHVHQATADKIPAPEEVPIEREKSVADYENEMRELLLEEERMKELHEHERIEAERRESERNIPPPIPKRPQSSFSTKSRIRINEDSLSELLVAVFKVAIRDTKNIAIVALSILVILLALRPGATLQASLPAVGPAGSVPEVLDTSVVQPPAIIQEKVVNVPSITTEITAVPPHKASEIPVQAVKKVEQRRLKATKPGKKSVKRLKAKTSRAPAAQVSKVAEKAPVETIVDDTEVESAPPIEEVIDEVRNPQNFEEDVKLGEAFGVEPEVAPAVYHAGIEETEHDAGEDMQGVQAQANLGAHVEVVEVEVKAEEFTTDSIEEVEKEIDELEEAEDTQFPDAVVSITLLSDEDLISHEDLQDTYPEIEDDDEAEEEVEEEDEM